MHTLKINSKTDLSHKDISFLREYFNVEHESEACDVGLFFENNSLLYRSADRGEIKFDFNELWQQQLNKKYMLSKEPLARSLGIKAGIKSHIWDMTCGSGKDSILLLKFGARVTAFERNPSVAALLLLAKKQFNSSALNIHFGQATESTDLLAEDPPSAIYYDPMFPEEGKKKSALPRKEMQIFKDLVGKDVDEEEVYLWAKSSGVKRFVVKRGVKSPTLKAKPSAQYTGKSARYDLYIFT